MTNLINYLDEIKQMFIFGDCKLILKRIIDLTLDSQNIEQYSKTVDLLDWIDLNEANTVSITEKLQERFNELAELLLKQTADFNNNPLITTVDLTKTYGNAAFRLGPVNLTIHEREIIGLVGENGNGKTTLLRSLCRELKPTSGSISYHFDYTDNYDLRSKLIYIPQRTKVCKGGLLENLSFTAAIYGLKGKENILMVDLVIARMGLRKFRNYSWKSLSSGYKMRFELARVLLQKPKILVIDEPLANLDIMAQQTVLDDFRHIAKSPFRPMGIVLSSQQLYEVEKASDEVIFLKNGAPRNLVKNETNQPDEIKQFIIEFESDWKQEALYELLLQSGLSSLKMNGGTYIANFPDTFKQEDFFKIIFENKVPVNYYRNITNSTRRFFIS